jgi:hypothetical protein
MRKHLFTILLLSVVCGAQTVNNNILPATTGWNLGSAQQRWNGFFQNIDISGTITGVPSLAGNNAFTGTNTFKSENATQVVTLGNPQGWAGSDVGGWVNSAIAALGSQGGRVRIGSGLYNYSTTIVKPRNVHIECDSADGTQLQYAGSTIGLVISDNGSPTSYPVDGLDKCYLAGPSAAGTTIGIYMGGDPASVISPAANYGDHQRLTQVRVSGFGTGVTFGNNAFLDVISLSGLFGNGKNYVIPSGLTNSGENMSIVASTIANATVRGLQNDLGTAEIYLTDSSVDANAAPEATCSAGQIHSITSHWEAQTGEFLAISGTCKGFIAGGQFLLDATTGTDTDFISVSGSSSPSLIVEGPIFASGTGHTVTQAINWTATGTNKVLFIGSLPNYNANAAIPALVPAAVCTTANTFQGLYINDGQGNQCLGSFWKMQNGAQVVVSGSGTSANTLQICDSVGSQCKYIRVASNVLQILNNAFGANLFTLDDSGNGIFTGNLNVNGGGGGTFTAGARARTLIADQGSFCTNGELALSAGWQATGSATVTSAAGTGQSCAWTITTGTTTAANPTITDTLTNGLPTNNTICWMNIYGGTHTAVAGESLRQTTISGTAPIFTANFTPTAAGTTYFVTRVCGP